MNEPTCPQADLVEALHDGRLGPRERVSLERHIAGCEECASRQRWLHDIREALRTPTIAPTALEHHRARLQLLRAAAGRPAIQPARLRWAGAAAVLVSATAAASMWSWSARSRSDVPGAHEPRSTMTSPDLRTPPSDSATPRDARATTTPSAEPDAQDAARAPTTNDAASPHAASSTAPPRATMSPSEPPPPSPTTEPTTEPTPVAPPASSASRDFAAAMADLGSGNFGVAAERFARFVSDHPHDPRCDEADYLVAIALQRAGSDAQAVLAAERYLATHPRGSHRDHAATIAKTTPR